MSQPPASFADLAERYRPEILAYLVRVLRDRHDAQDTCQDTFLRAQRAFGRLAPDANSRAWLYRIATNSALNAARRRSRRAARTAEVDLDTLPDSVGSAPERREQLRAVARGVQALPPRQRSALMLRRFQGLGYAEVAASLGTSEAAARANVYQAIKKLRAMLGGADQ
jgi:RNA polymerase sigma-70 factor (ECF subfamily)